MKGFIAFLCLFSYTFFSSAQSEEEDFTVLRSRLMKQFRDEPSGEFTDVASGVASHFNTRKKVIAFTFDACGGPTGSGYDRELINYLRSERIPATLFISGLWIDVNAQLLKELSADSLFEIENHGTLHRPCTTKGLSRYKIKGTGGVGEVVDEIELNARRIERITKRKPIFFRSGTATTDAASAKIAQALGETIVSYDVLSGDAVANTPADVIRKNILKQCHEGGIVIMHMNRPAWNGFEAFQAVVPELRKMGYSFVQLKHQSLVTKK